MEKELNITVNQQDPEKPAVLIVREGDAPTLNEPVQFANKALSVASIAEWVGKRPYPSNPLESKAVIIFCKDPESPHIILMDDPTDELATRLEAHLKVNPDFTAFGINEHKTFSQEHLQKFVRQYAHCFEDIKVVEGLISSLRNFEARYEQVVSKADDRQGNKEALAKEAIKLTKGELPTTLKLRMPFYKNTEPQSFVVEVEVDRLQNNLPGFSFWSMDVELRKRKLAEDTITAAVDELKGKFPCLEV